MWAISLALLVVVISLWLAWRWKQTSTFSRLNIPGPKPSILFGNLIELYQKGPLKCHEEWVEKYGRIVGYYYGMKPILMVADPHLLKTIFIKDFSKFIDRVSFSPLQPRVVTSVEGLSVLNLTGQKWKQVRSVLTPTFSTAKMKKMSVTMNSSIDEMVDVMREKSKKKEEFDIHDAFKRLTMDVIARTAFGVKSNVQRERDSKALDAAKVLFHNDFEDPLVFIALCLPSLKWLARKLQTLKQSIRFRGVNPIQMLRRGIKRVIDFRRKNPESRIPDLLQIMLDTKINSLEDGEVNLKNLEAGDENDLEETDAKGESQKSLRNMTDAEIISSSVTVFLAGYETTSTALAFTSYLLGKHPDVQERAFEEINELISNGGKLDYAAVNKLPYLEKVLNESMRLYPPVYLFVNRYACEDVDYGGLKIPKDMHVCAPTYLLQHDPEYWADPESFDPERFNSKPNSDGITYLPFGIGPRNCMGMRFAQMEAKLALAHVIYNFHLKLSPSQVDNFPFKLRLQTLTPKDGVKVKLEARNQETNL